MQRALNIRRLAAAALLTSCLVGATAVSAESAYVKQTSGHARLSDPAVQPSRPTTNAARSSPPTVNPNRTNPEAFFASGGNYANTLQIGNYNQVIQTQYGANNASYVGIIAGNHNNVGVLQAGNNLRSSLVLLNTSSLNVGVIQPNGSAPVNMFIARLPNGALLIKR